jgi:enoyl-CoA hydratase/carnithine racemase
MRAAKQIVLTGDPIDAYTAQRIGLITSVSSSAEALYEDARQLSEQMASLPTRAVQVTKASFAAHPLPDYVTWETDHAVECWSEPERLAAMRAFLNKRNAPKTS